MLDKPKPEKITRVTFRDVSTGKSLTTTVYDCTHVDAHNDFIEALIAKRVKKLVKLKKKRSRRK